MKNIQEELQHHVLKENKLQVKTIMVTSFTGKEAQNSEEHKKTCWLLHTGFILKP